MVKIDRVYTRSGDDGRTNLGDGSRLPKFHIRVAANGSLDEANSFIGLASLDAGESTKKVLVRIQNDLFDVGADLSKPERSGLKAEPLRITDAQVRWLERNIDDYNSNLTPLRSFVLPSGSLASVYLHVARCVVRRAEREVTEIAFQEPITPAIIRYVNRLSDLLFVLARVENGNGMIDIVWEPGLYRR
jgi:cob(I)alamin adenosyltransferase